VTHTAEVRSLEKRPTSFASLYAHWERNQWSALELDFSPDAEAFGRLDSEAREGSLWIFGHRFHAELNVAGLLAPFLLAGRITKRGFFLRHRSQTNTVTSRSCCVSTARCSG
jgi:hypothetical protein